MLPAKHTGTLLSVFCVLMVISPDASATAPLTGNIVVGNIYTTGGVSVGDFSSHGTTSYPPDQGASDIGYGPDGDLYVANEATGTVYRYNGSNLVASYPGLTEVGSLVVRSDGTLLAASRATGTNVIKRLVGGSWVNFATGLTLTGGRMVFGPDKTSDGNADLFVATTAGVYYWDGQNGGSSPTLFASKSGMTPSALTFRPTDGNLYVGTSVPLTMSAPDGGSGVSQMRFSNDYSSWSSWESYATSKAWTLTSGGGTKTVHAQFKDAADIVSTHSDTIILDTALPLAGTVTPPASATTSTIDVPYSGASDGGSGLKQVELWYKKETGGTWTNSGLTKTAGSDTFTFTPSSGSGRPCSLSIIISFTSWTLSGDMLPSR